MNILLDTNMFYALSGMRDSSVSKEKLMKLQLEHRIYATSVTIAECVLGNKSDLEVIKRIIFPLVGNTSEFVSCGYLDIPWEEIRMIMKASTLSEIQSVISAWTKRKIDCEVGFALLFVNVYIITLGRSQAVHKLKNDQQGLDLFNKQLFYYCEKRCSEFEKYFVKALSTQYKIVDGKPQKVAKEAFAKIVTEARGIIPSLVKASENNTNVFDLTLSNEQVNSFICDYDSRSIKREIGEEILEETIQLFKKDRKFIGLPIMIGYVEHIIRKIMFENKVFQVNDISDTCQMAGLNSISEPSYMLTGDNAMNSYLREIGKLYVL